MTSAELRGLLRDCLVLWAVVGRVEVGDDGVTVSTAEGVFTVSAAHPDLRPVRWFLLTPERSAVGRPARAIPSIVALLSAVRSATGGENGDRLRIGA